MNNLLRERNRKLFQVKQFNAVFVERKYVIGAVDKELSRVLVECREMYKKPNGKLMSVPSDAKWVKIDPSMIRPINKSSVSHKSSMGGDFVNVRYMCMGYFVNAEDRKKILADFDR